MKTLDLDKIVRETLKEDAGREDITTKLLIPRTKRSGGAIIANEDAVVCGLSIAKKIFQKLDRNISFRSLFKDGDKIKKGAKLVSIKGKAWALLAGERPALNVLGYLSGIATRTNLFVQTKRPFKAQILDTRKTTPGLRIVEKYAVRCGGGINHRMNLEDMVLIKDNHLAIFQNSSTIKEILQNVKKKTKKPIEIEVDNLKQFKEALHAEPDMILLDNMSLHQLRQAVKTSKRLPQKKRPLLEASGGITLKNVRSVAKTGVDRISIGSLTQAHQAINFSMELTN